MILVVHVTFDCSTARLTWANFKMKCNNNITLYLNKKGKGTVKYLVNINLIMIYQIYMIKYLVNINLIVNGKNVIAQYTKQIYFQ